MIILLPSLVFAAQVPSSNLSLKTAQRIAPLLEKQLQEKGLEYGSDVFIRIIKSKVILEVWVKKEQQFTLFKTYPICYFSGKLGSKTKQGDHQAPEGFYTIKPHQMNPFSRYHLAFNLGYPNKYDRSKGYTGNYLMVHGECVSIGCYAMGNDMIEEIYLLLDAALRRGQKEVAVHIFPFPMRDFHFKKHADPQWNAFWQMIKPAYDLFEKNHIPPKVTVKNKQYVIESLGEEISLSAPKTLP